MDEFECTLQVADREYYDERIIGFDYLNRNSLKKENFFDSICENCGHLFKMEKN